MVKQLIFAASLLALAGCGQWKQAYGDFCDVAEPHFHTKEAQRAMTEEQLATETKHNEYGEQKCKWKPKPN